MRSCGNDGKIHFKDLAPLDKAYEAMYLGNELNREVNIGHEIQNKIQEVIITWKKLDPYWRSDNASKKWQVIIFDAVVRSKLLYGLETVHLTDAMSNKLDAFQIRGLRKILKIAPTHVNRANTNKHVLERATQHAYPHHTDNRKVELFSVFQKKRKAKLLGHILRALALNTLRQVSFQPHSAQRVEYGKKRVGKPRQSWIHQTKQFAYVDICSMFSYTESRAEDLQLLQYARNQRF